MSFKITSILIVLVAIGSSCSTAPQSKTDHVTARVPSSQSTSLAPLVNKGHPVDWWFVFKLNSGVFPGCGVSDQSETDSAARSCIFGGSPHLYKGGKWGQQFVYASSEHPTLTEGAGCVGDSVQDPLGATFDQIYNGTYFYVVWNDQFYGDPKIAGCSKSCSAPWGHSKGVLAWDREGNGVVIQVSTPSWPASGSKNVERQSDGNTLGCISDNDVLVSQHFFSLKLTHSDVVSVLKGLQNASVVTNTADKQIVNNGGPQDIVDEVDLLGQKSENTRATVVELSSGVKLISKPSGLHVPPWQMVSALLGGVDLRAATWWSQPSIPATQAETAIDCWDPSLPKKRGAVEIATQGLWDGKAFSLLGIPRPDGNHAKIGVTTSGENDYTIFGDMNQQGAINGDCSKSQNGRGGLFYVVEDKKLTDSVSKLIQ